MSVDTLTKEREAKVAKTRTNRKPKQLSTADRIEAYELAEALLRTWEKQPQEVQIREHDSILKLRAKVRQFRMLIEHRADPKAVV